MFKMAKWIVVSFVILINLILVYHVVETTIFAIFISKFDFQIFAFLLLSLILVLISTYFLIKTKNENRMVTLFVLSVISFFVFQFSFFIPTVNKNIEIKYCLDNGKIWNNGECK